MGLNIILNISLGSFVSKSERIMHDTIVPEVSTIIFTYLLCSRLTGYAS